MNQNEPGTRIADIDIKDDCFLCHTTLLNEPMIVYQNQRYHAHHFKCEQCQCILNQKMRDFNGKFYCPEHYAYATAPTCAVCSQPILSSAINALGKSYHPEVRMDSHSIYDVQSVILK